MTLLIPTAEQIAAAGNDYSQALAKLQYEKALADHREAQTRKPAENSPYKINPTEAEIAMEMMVSGNSHEVAAADLAARWAEDARKIAAYHPTAIKRIGEARTIADEATRAADELAEHQKSVVDQITSGINAVASYRLQIRHLEKLILTKEKTEALANAAIQAHGERIFLSSPEVDGAFNSATTQLAQLAPLQKFLPTRIAKIEDQARAQIAETFALIKREGIEIRNFMASLSADRDWRSGGHATWDSTLVPEFYA